MVEAHFRFYEELNDFLPTGRRKRTFAHDCARGATVKHALEALGVPHTEVEVILVNGESVDFGHCIRAGDRISVYPVFETFDVSPLLRLRPEPLRRVRFHVDVHLGRLARYLRMLGFDTTLAGDVADADIARTAVAEHRVLLTRDRRLLKHRIVTHGCLVRSDRPRCQVQEILERLHLRHLARPFTRCMACNGILETVDKARVEPCLPPGILRDFHRFLQCPGCRKVYWEGSHFRRMKVLVEELMTSCPHRGAPGRPC